MLSIQRCREICSYRHAPTDGAHSYSLGPADGLIYMPPDSLPMEVRLRSRSDGLENRASQARFVTFHSSCSWPGSICSNQKDAPESHYWVDQGEPKPHY